MNTLYAAFSAGFSLGFSLIIAIGAQNAFVLKQGLRNSHVLAVCLICAFSDVLLIAVGVSGFAVLVGKIGWLETAALYFGAAFLFAYGVRSFYKAGKSSATLQVDGGAPAHESRSATVLTCLALTWLNPHVYLDTVFLLGSVSTHYPGGKLAFAGGASLASFTVFFTLGYAARFLTPFFRKPGGWRVLEFIIGVVMWWIAVSLLMGR